MHNIEKKENCDMYQRTQMQKEMIIHRLKEQGLRITKQRLMLLDVILAEECSCCKEIHYKASKLDDRIGSATVYRMINILEEIGAISRRNVYKIACREECDKDTVCTIELDDDTEVELTAGKWKQVMQAGLLACGYVDGQTVRHIRTSPCCCAEG